MFSTLASKGSPRSLMQSFDVPLVITCWNGVYSYKREGNYVICRTLTEERELRGNRILLGG